MVYALFAVIVLALVPVAGVWGLGLDYFFGVFVPYITIAVFLVGFIYRILKWAGAPVPFHIPTVCGQQKSLPWIKSSRIESPSSTGAAAVRVAYEVALFRSLFRNEKFEIKKDKKLIFGGNRWLWLGGLAFHWSLFVILFRHSRYFFEPVPGIVTGVQNLDGIFQLAVPTLYLTNIVILLGLTYLFLRRIVFTQAKYISIPSDYFILFLIGGIAITGVLMRHFFQVDIIAVKELAMGLVRFRPVLTEGLGSFFYIHLFLVSALLAYLPFSKLMHLAGILLSPTRNLLNNSRARRHVNPWNPEVKTHTYEEYEDEFRKSMKDAGVPVDKE